MEKQNIPLFTMPSEGRDLRDLPPAEHAPRDRMATDHESESGCGCDGDCGNSGCGGHDVSPLPVCTGYEGCGANSMGLCEHPLAMVYAPCQYFRALYDPATALRRGTLFSELDLPLGCNEGVFTTTRNMEERRRI